MRFFLQYHIGSFTAPIVRNIASGALAFTLLGCGFAHEREREAAFETGVANDQVDTTEAPVSKADSDDDRSADAVEIAREPEVANDNTVAPDQTHTATVVPLGEPMGTFQLTYYWMAAEGHSDAPRDVTLYTSTCKPLATITSEYAKRLLIEGTGRLRNGRTVNVSGECDCPLSPCFFVVGRDKSWGVGVRYRPLRPFRSVAVDPSQIPIGTALYVPELDGLTMPGKAPWGGFVHDGCVMADDRGGGVEGQQLDFFMGLFSFYDGFFKRHRILSVTVHDGESRCKVDNGTLVPVNRNAI